MINLKLDKSQIGLAGEYYVLAQLTSRGLIATLTLGNTKGIDILVTNQEANKLFKVEVKSTQSKISRSLLFSDKKQYQWTMSKKHEKIIDENLIYCFVHFESVDKLPKFFLVPSKKVATYVENQHRKWLNERNGTDNPMRKFRILIDDPENFENNWSLFSV